MSCLTGTQIHSPLLFRLSALPSYMYVCSQLCRYICSSAGLDEVVHVQVCGHSNRFTSTNHQPTEPCLPCSLTCRNILLSQSLPQGRGEGRGCVEDVRLFSAQEGHYFFFTQEEAIYCGIPTYSLCTPCNSV